MVGCLHQSHETIKIMKYKAIFLAGATAFAGVAAQAQEPKAEAKEAAAEKKEEPKAMSLKEAVTLASYNFGRNLGKQLKDDKLVDRDLFIKGIKDVLAGKGEDADEMKLREAMGLMQAEMQKNEQAEAEKYKKKNVDYLTENGKKEGIKITKSGLQYQVLREGKGDAPKATDTVKVHYSGKLIDGTEFDSSYKRNEPIEFPLNRVIKGWTEGVQLMKPGSKFKFFIPQELAYGPQGSQTIPGFSTLVFEVELLEVIKADAPAPAPAPLPEPQPKK